MKSKSIKAFPLIFPILILNTMVATLIRPVSILGIVVMNVVYCAVLMAALPALRRHAARRNS